MEIEWPAYLDEYEKLVIRMNSPRVIIDNAGCSNATRVTIDSARKHGILLEIVQILTDLNLSIKKAYISSDGRWFMDGSQIEDSQKICKIEKRLKNLLEGDNDFRSASITVPLSVTHTERRLHQMMFADRDYEKNSNLISDCCETAIVSVQNCLERGYSVVNIRCKDRMKLLFDVLCTLTDMDYIVYHATINTSLDRAYLEFFIRHRDGTPISSEAEKQRVILCLQAAIERRASQGVRLELCVADRLGLLADVTRTFRENGLNVTRTEISTTMDTALNVFYITDENGNVPDPKTVEYVREKIGYSCLKVKELPLLYREKVEERSDAGVGGAVLLSLGSLVKRNLYNLGFIKS